MKKVFSLLIVLTLFLVALVHTISMKTLTRISDDFRQRVFPSHKFSQQIVIVDIGNGKNQDRQIEYDVHRHLQFIKFLEASKPAGLVYVVSPKDFEYSNDLNYFVKEVQKYDITFKIFSSDFPELDYLSHHPLLSKLNFFKYDFMTIDLASYSQDNGMRRFRLLVENGYNPIVRYFEERKIKYSSNIRGGFLHAEEIHAFIRSRPKELHKVYTWEYLESLSEKERDHIVGGNLVLVANPQIEDVYAYKKTPLSYKQVDTHLVYVVADTFLTMIFGDNPKVPPKWISYTVTFLLVFGLLVLLVFAPPMMAAIWAVPYLLMTWLLGFAIFGISDWLIDLAHSTVAMVIIIFLALPYLVIRFLRQKDEQLKQKELELVQARVAAKSAKADLGFRIAVQVAHDLRSPLSAISTVAHLAKEDLRPDFYQLLNEGVTRLNMLSHDLLERYRTGISKMNNVNTAIDVETNIQDLLESYRVTFADVQFELELTGQSFICEIGKISLDRVMSNLLTNAVEAMGGVGKIKVKTSADHDYFYIEVEDTGPGVSEHLQKKLFQEGATEGKSEGTGIGLYSSKKLLQQFAGDLKFISGSKFCISLPKNKKLLKLEMMQTAVVCVVDDDEAVRKLWKQILEGAGIQQVFTFASISDLKRDLLYEKPLNNMWLISDLVFDQEDQTGFDVISHFAGAGVKNLILCSSLSENAEVQKISQRFGARVIGKQQLSQLEVVVV